MEREVAHNLVVHRALRSGESASDFQVKLPSPFDGVRWVAVRDASVKPLREFISHAAGNNRMRVCIDDDAYDIYVPCGWSGLAEVVAHVHAQLASIGPGVALRVGEDQCPVLHVPCVRRALWVDDSPLARVVLAFPPPAAGAPALREDWQIEVPLEDANVSGGAGGGGAGPGPGPGAAAERLLTGGALVCENYWLRAVELVGAPAGATLLGVRVMGAEQQHGGAAALLADFAGPFAQPQGGDVSDQGAVLPADARVRLEVRVATGAALMSAADAASSAAARPRLRLALQRSYLRAGCRVTSAPVADNAHGALVLRCQEVEDHAWTPGGAAPAGVALLTHDPATGEQRALSLVGRDTFGAVIPRLNRLTFRFETLDGARERLGHVSVQVVLAVGFLRPAFDQARHVGFINPHATREHVFDHDAAREIEPASFEALVRAGKHPRGGAHARRGGGPAALSRLAPGGE
jgi:hypothetical protein